MEFLSIVIKVTFNVNKMFNQTKYVDIDIFIFDKFFMLFLHIEKIIKYEQSSYILYSHFDKLC